MHDGAGSSRLNFMATRARCILLNLFSFLIRDRYIKKHVSRVFVNSSPSLIV